MKALNIIGLVLAVAVIPISIYYIEMTNTARWSSWDYFNGYSNYSGPSAGEISFEAGSICLLFGLFFIGQTIANMAMIKTTTTKVLSIISISLIGLAVLFNFAFILSGGGTTFDEGGQIWMIAGLIMIAFSIVFLVQCIWFAKGRKPRSDYDLIDDEEFV